jgi:hypothetical protein
MDWVKIYSYPCTFTSSTLRAKDLFLLDDLWSLAIPWIDRLVQDCPTTGIERVWNVIRRWGPDYEDVRDIASNSETFWRFKGKVANLREVVRLTEGRQPRSP